MKRFDLALKYYEMAASYDYDEAYECLGYIWYYGRTGERDYKKAFEYFSKMMNKGHLVASYKVADMYKNGYYVEKNMETYKKIIEFNEDYFDFYDLYYLLKTTHTITFEYDGKEQKLFSELEGDECNVCFNGKWFRSCDAFFKKAEIGDTNIKLTAVADQLYGFTLVN